MKSKLFLYAPYIFYKAKFLYSKKRELNEFEAIILLFLYDNKKTQPAKRMLDSLLEKMNLLSKKESWKSYILEILKKLNNKEIIIDDFNDIDYITNDEVKFDDNIWKSIENDEYLGLEDKTIDKQFDLYYSLIDGKKIISDINKVEEETLNNLSNLNFKKVSIENMNISDKLNQYGENVFADPNYVFKKYELINQELFNKNENVVWSKTNEINYEINIDKNKITITDLIFENIRSFFLNEGYEKEFREMINEIYNSNINPLYKELKNQKTNIIKNIDLYDEISNLLKMEKIANSNWIILDGSIQEITYFTNEFTLNDEYKIILPVLSSRIVNERELREVFDLNYNNYNFCELLLNIKDEEQNNSIKNLILSNYKITYRNPFYRKLILENLQKINNLDSNWIINDDFNNQDFESCVDNNEICNFLINLIANKTIELLTTNMVFKLNYIKQKKDLSIDNLKLILPKKSEYFKEKENIEKIKQLIEKNKITEANEQINKLEKQILFNENKILLTDLIKTNKTIMFENVLKLMDVVSQNIDKKYRILSDSENSSASPDECIKKIERENLLNNQEIKELDLIRKYRNKYTHERESFKLEFSRKTFEELNNDYEIIYKYFGGKK